jgi:predicted nucleotide-binding protein
MKEEDDMTIGQTLKAYSPPKPKVPRGEAIRRIQEQIEIGRAIRDTRMFSMTDLDTAQERRSHWLENQTHMLTRLFNDSFLEEQISTDISSDIDSAITFGLKEKYFKDDINQQIGRLESFLERLKQDRGEHLTEESMRQEQPKEVEPKEVRPGAGSTTEKSSRGKLTRKEPSKEPPSIEKPLILLIHGQNGTAKGHVLEFIDKLGLRAFTSHEQTNGVKDLIEKFSDLSNIQFAIVLFTPDDATTPQDKPRGKGACLIQDIMFEFGYVVAKLGHERVCALCHEGVKIPLDHYGETSIPMDSKGGWRLLVAKEIKQAGIKIDLNKAI